MLFCEFEAVHHDPALLVFFEAIGMQRISVDFPDPEGPQTTMRSVSEPVEVDPLEPRDTLTEPLVQL